MLGVKACPVCRSVSQPRTRGAVERVVTSLSGPQERRDADSLWEINRRVYYACLYNPFVTSLINGTLSRGDFTSYSENDAIYLATFLASLKTVHGLVSARPVLFGEAHKKDLALKKASFLVESGEHELSTTQARCGDGEQLSWAARSYIKFLVQAQSDSEYSIPEVLASVIPCFRLYAELATHMRRLALLKYKDLSEHPYGEWIVQYSSEESWNAVRAAEWIFDEYIDVEALGRATALYRQAMESELAFFGAHASLSQDDGKEQDKCGLLVVEMGGMGGMGDGCTLDRVCLDTLCGALTARVHVVLVSGAGGIAASRPIRQALERHGLLVEEPENVSNINFSRVGSPAQVQLTHEAGGRVMEHFRGSHHIGWTVYIAPGESISNNDALAEASLGIILDPDTSSKSIRPLDNYCLDIAASDGHVNHMYHTTSWDEIHGIVSGLTWDRLKEEEACKSRQQIPRVLLVSGSDSGGGAGLQADIKTCASCGVFSTNAVTAVTAQNTVGVHETHILPGEVVRNQIRAVDSDIGVTAVKIGMLGSVDNVQVVSEELRAMRATRLSCAVVVDPVLLSSSGACLAEEGLLDVLKTRLFPLANLITPNVHEAAMLLGHDSPIDSIQSMRTAAMELHTLGPDNVLIKGGHLTGVPVASDVLFDGRTLTVFSKRFLENTDNSHGTGCTLASAIASHLARGESMVGAIERGKEYVWRAMERSAGLDIGSGPQKPMNHFHELGDRHDWRDLGNWKPDGSDPSTRYTRIPNDIDVSLYAVTSAATTAQGKSDDEILKVIRAVVAGGASAIQIRDKISEGGRLTRLVSKAVRVCRPYGVSLIVNDRVDVAIAADACGVHIGQGDIPAHVVRRMIGPHKILGVSCKTVELGRRAQREGADYLGCGAVFDTPTKDSRRIGSQGVRKIKEHVDIPVVAIGGLDAENVFETLEESCADGVAVVRAIFDAENAELSTATLRSIVDAALST